MNGEEKEGSIEERKSNELSIMTVMMMNWAQTKLHVKDEEYQHAVALIVISWKPVLLVSKYWMSCGTL